jgi:hypothetical protein
MYCCANRSKPRRSTPGCPYALILVLTLCRTALPDRAVIDVLSSYLLGFGAFTRCARWCRKCATPVGKLSRRVLVCVICRLDPYYPKVEFLLRLAIPETIQTIYTAVAWAGSFRRALLGSVIVFHN